MLKKRIIKISLLILLMLFGVFMWVFGEYDDSPGAQLLGLIAGVGATFGIIKIHKDKK